MNYFHKTEENLSQTKKFEKLIIKMLKSSDFIKIDRFLDGHIRCNYNVRFIRTAMIFRLLGSIKMSANNKFILLNKLSKCFDNRLDKKYTNLTIIESISLGYDVNKNMIENFGLFDCKIEGKELALYLYENNLHNLLEIYLKSLSEEVYQIHYKLSLIENVDNNLLDILKENINIPCYNDSILQIDKIVLKGTFLKIEISEKDIVSLEINNKPVLNFLEEQINYIYQIKLVTSKNFINDDDLKIAIINILGFELHINNKICFYDIPPFFEYFTGINYLESYYKEINHYVFEYDYSVLSTSIFPNKEFQAVISGKLDLDINEKIDKEKIKSISDLSLFFDVIYEFLSLEDVIANLKLLDNLKKLRLYFEDGHRPVNIDVKRIVENLKLEYILIKAEDIHIRNIENISNKKIAISFRSSNSVEIFINERTK